MTKFLSIELSKKLLAHAAIVLAESTRPITSESINSLLKKTGTNIEPFFVQMFSDAFSKINYKALKELVSNTGIGVQAAPVQKSAVVEEKPEEIKEPEEEEESDEEVNMDLFD